MVDELGIMGYGVCIQLERVATETIVRKREGRRKDIEELLSKIRNGLLLQYKSIANSSEDTTTLAT